MNKRYQAFNRITAWMLLLLTFGLITVSCTDETFVGEGGNKHAEDQMAVRLTISTPATQKPETRSTEQEELIEEICVLVLSRQSADLEYQFLYSVEGININHPNNNTTTFTAMLKSSNDPVKLILIANASQTVAEKYPEAGDTETRLKEKLVYELDNGNGSPEQITGYLPMYGEHSFPKLDAAQVNADIQIRMLRSVARADVYNNDATGHFRLQSIQVFRPYDKMQLIPYNTTVNSEGGPKVDTPSLPDQSVFYPTGFPMPQQNIAGNNTSIEQIYLPEAPAPATGKQISDATCLVAGGIYDDGVHPAKTVYYRIDFKPSGHPLGQILRNHRYIFLIQKVSAAGWNTPEEAAVNASSGIIATVESWDEHTTDMYFDGEHHYGVSTRHLKLQYRMNSKGVIYIDTDLAGDLLQWVDADGTPTGNGELSSSLSSARFEVSLSQETDSDNNIRRVIQCRAKQPNDSYSDYSEYIMIHVNRWKIMITITQSANSSRDEIIHILSTNGIGGIDYASSRPMKAILDNHFGIGKTVQLGGIAYSQIPISINETNLPYSKLAQQDILILGYDSRPDSASARRILDWLGARKNRVLVIGTDWKAPGINDSSGSGRPETAYTTNYQLLKLLREDVIPYWYNGADNESIGDTGPSRSALITSFDPTTDNDYFFRTGPFTESLATGITNCSYWINDALWGRMEVHSPNIIPLIRFKNVVKDDGSGSLSSYTPYLEGDGRMILGVDKKKRIVYMGDSQIFEIGSGNTVKANSRIDNNVGNLTNDYSRIMANLWAWMIEEVVLGNNE
ncbi:MAG: hypothetical protein LUH01_15680 [Parabacteroides gordonii]|nr:hypothetical protein [Parabacteroides gordonii]